MLMQGTDASDEDACCDDDRFLDEREAAYIHGPWCIEHQAQVKNIVNAIAEAQRG